MNTTTKSITFQISCQNKYLPTGLSGVRSRVKKQQLEELGAWSLLVWNLPERIPFQCDFDTEEEHENTLTIRPKNRVWTIISLDPNHYTVDNHLQHTKSQNQAGFCHSVIAMLTRVVKKNLTRSLSMKVASRHLMSTAALSTTSVDQPAPFPWRCCCRITQ